MRQGEAINGSPWMMRPSVWSYVTLSLEPDINLQREKISPSHVATLSIR